MNVSFLTSALNAFQMGWVNAVDYEMDCFSQRHILTDKVAGLLDSLVESTCIFLNVPCCAVEIWQ